MLSKKKQGASVSSATGASPWKKLFLAGIAVGMTHWMTSQVHAQGCDSPGCRCQQGQHGHHQDCQAVTVFDRIDSLADRLETGLDRVFGRVISKKKQCQCANCRGRSSGIVAPTGIETISLPEEPGIADPLPILTIEPHTKTESHTRTDGTHPLNPSTTSRPRLPLKATESKREFPTSTEGSLGTESNSGVPSTVRPKQPAIELRPLERAPATQNKSTREPGVIIPEWLDDPFKEDQSRKELTQPQRILPAPTAPSNDIRWSKRPTLEQQSQNLESPPQDVSKQETVKLNISKPDIPKQTIAAPPAASKPITLKMEVPKAEASSTSVSKSEPVLRFRIGDRSSDRAATQLEVQAQEPQIKPAGGRISDRDEPAVVKASADQPIRITFPTKK